MIATCVLKSFEALWDFSSLKVTIIH